MSGTAHWLLDTTDRVATLTLNRPQAKNSLLPETFAELRAITADLRRSKDVWAVIVQGEGGHFSTGLDTSVVEKIPVQSEQSFKEQLLEMQLALDEFEALEKPTIAKLRGFCIGGGLLLALCCDFRIASEKTVFVLPEVKLGLSVAMGTQRITRVAGIAVTKQLILLTERFNAATAQKYGLVHQVVPPDQLDSAVDALAARFRGLPPRTVGIAKRIINQGVELSLRASEDLEIDSQAELIHSPDLHEAIESYLTKRTPQFIGE
jgi:enoyl-CoA hydratase